MYSTVRRYEGVKNAAEVGRKTQDGFVPLMKKIPGFVAYYWADAGGGVVFSISIFETKAGAEESDRRAAEWRDKNLAGLYSSPPQITAGEVRATDRMKAAA